MPQLCPNSAPPTGTARHLSPSLEPKRAYKWRALYFGGALCTSLNGVEKLSTLIDAHRKASAKVVGIARTKKAKSGTVRAQSSEHTAPIAADSLTV